MPTAGVLLLAALASVCFAPGLPGGFLFDDYPNLVLEPAWQLNSLTLDEGRRALSSGIASNAGRPLAMLSFALNHYFTGLDPFWLKATGLSLHLLNGLLIYALCRRLFTLVRTEPTPGHWAAFLCAAAWLVHPLQVSSALYIVQRMEVGAATGILLTLLAYLRCREAQIAARRGWPWLLAAAAALLLGLGFKETALLAPLYAFLIEVCLLRFAAPAGRVSRPWIAAYGIAFVVAGLAYLCIAAPLVLDSAGAYARRDFSLPERLLTQLPVLCMYLQQILLPWPETLRFYYDDFPISRSLFDPPSTALCGALLALLGGIAIASWRRWPLVTLGLGWFFAGHALTSNVWPLELAFEHRNYLPLLGIMLALVQPACALGSLLTPRARETIALLPVLLLAALCWLQSSSWGDPLRLAWTLENRAPHSPRASYALGKELLRASNGVAESSHWKMAEQLFIHSSSLPRASALPSQGLLIMHARHGTTPPPETWPRFRAALTQKPLTAEAKGALYAVSQCRMQANCQLDDRELLQTFLAVLQRNPRNPTALTLYANYAWNVLKDPDLSIRVQRDAVRLVPEQVQYRLALAKFLLATGQAQHRREGEHLAHGLLLAPQKLSAADLRELQDLLRMPGR